MKTAQLLLAFSCLMLSISCNSDQKTSTELKDDATKKVSAPTPADEKYFLNLGGEEQYIEVMGNNKENPVLLFVHGGPAWPQTPQFRYYNFELAQDYTVVLWEQRGAGKSFAKNPDPSNLTLKQIVADGHELTQHLKKKFNKQKIYLAGYSWGSCVGVELAKDFPTDYTAYIGIAQMINMDRSLEISQTWLKRKASIAKDDLAMKSIDSLSNLSNYEDKLDLFFNQWLLLNKFGGATYNKESEKETEKAMAQYEDYKDYDWFAVWEKSSKALTDDMYGIKVDEIAKLELPVFLLQGRHDWNIPSILALEWLNNLQAPKKEIFWFEKSGHGPLEEEAQKFNEVMLSIPKQMN